MGLQGQCADAGQWCNAWVLTILKSSERSMFRLLVAISALLPTFAVLARGIAPVAATTATSPLLLYTRPSLVRITGTCQGEYFLPDTGEVYSDAIPSIYQATGLLVSEDGSIATEAAVLEKLQADLQLEQTDISVPLSAPPCRERLRQHLAMEIARRYGTATTLPPEQLRLASSTYILQQLQERHFDRTEAAVLASGKGYPLTRLPIEGDGSEADLPSIAILKVEMANAPTLPLLTFDTLRLEQPVAIVGYPLLQYEQVADFFDRNSPLSPSLEISKATVMELPDRNWYGQTSLRVTVAGAADGAGIVVNDNGEAIGLALAGDSSRGESSRVKQVTLATAIARYLENLDLAYDNDASGDTEKIYREGLGFYWQAARLQVSGQYDFALSSLQLALERFETAQSLFPQHTEIDFLLADSREQLSAVQQQVNRSRQMRIFILLGLVVAGGAATFSWWKWFRRRRRRSSIAPGGYPPRRDLQMPNPVSLRPRSASSRPLTGASPRNGYAQWIPDDPYSEPGSNDVATDVRSVEDYTAASESPLPWPSVERSRTTPPEPLINDIFDAKPPDRDVEPVTDVVAVAAAPVEDATQFVSDRQPIGIVSFTSGKLAGRSFPIPEAGLLVGRNSNDVDIAIGHPNISRRHVWIGPRQDRVLLVDFNTTNGTFLNDPNGPRAMGKIVLEPGTTVILADDVARFQYLRASRDDMTRLSAEPLVHTEERLGSIVCSFCAGATLVGQRFPIPPRGMFVGRDSKHAQVVIPHSEVSNLHVWIGPKDGRVYAIDQGSLNGTFLNTTQSEPVDEVALSPNDTIILAKSEIARFRYEPAGTPATSQF
jgi:pSer/pThr/pTyr-binding forkhead associated (FHA) protein